MVGGKRALEGSEGFGVAMTLYDSSRSCMVAAKGPMTQVF